jgi:glycosyltransferase involved in cell wall biosynthesis
MGVNPTKIVSCPYSVNNDFFRSKYDTLKDQKLSLRQKHNIPENHLVFLTSGKYIHKKRPLDVIKAFHAATKTNQKATLVMVGDGNLRAKMESYITENEVGNVILTGFVNQSEIPEFYALSDVYVMASGAGETWGLSSNEAMLFNLPVIIASLAGSSSDLVRSNGYTFPTDDVDALSKAVTSCLNKPLNELREMGDKSYEIIQSYSYDAMMDGIKNLLNSEDSINR